jgi:DNA-binding winged helix-turn-helix (wHTH) protein
MRARIADFLFDAAARTLTRGGVAVALTPKAFALLEALVDVHPAAASKDVLYTRLWPDVIVEPGNLHNLVSELRAALGASSIRTVQRFGYALAAPLQREAAARFLLAGAVDLPLHDGETIVGRETTGAPDVSRRHARLIVDGSRVTVEDLGSKNGTFINGTSIGSITPLAVGDEVVFGRARFVFRSIDDDSTISLFAEPLS